MHSPHFVMLISGIFTVNRVHGAWFFLVLIYLSRYSGQLSHREVFCYSAVCYFSQCVDREFSGIRGFSGSTWQITSPFLLTSIVFLPVLLLFRKAARFHGEESGKSIKTSLNMQKPIATWGKADFCLFLTENSGVYVKNIVIESSFNVYICMIFCA